MSTEVRCGRCGRLVVAPGGPGEKVRCPSCRGGIRVPAGLEGPPQPRARIEQQVIARAVPWIVSVMFHASVALILAFIVMLTVAEGPTEHQEITLGPYHRPGPPLAATNKPDGRLLRQPKPVAERGASLVEGGVVTHLAERKIDLDLSLWAKPGLEVGRLAPPGPPGDGPMFDPGQPVPPGRKAAKYIVFVIDRSGSMVDTFRRVRVEILNTVARMSKDQYFHVILFCDGPPIENRPRRLVSATAQRKLDLVGFLRPVRASGRTDVLPALKRAFEVLAGAKGKDNKLIHLLTDGVFPDNNKVLALIRQSKAGRGIRINTYLCGNRPPAADAVMKKIALESKGVYNYVSLAE